MNAIQPALERCQRKETKYRRENKYGILCFYSLFVAGCRCEKVIILNIVLFVIISECAVEPVFKDTSISSLSTRDENS